MTEEQAINEHVHAEKETETLDVRSVAKLLGVSRATVLRWIQARKLEGFFQIGKKWLVKKADFEDFINDKKVSSKQ